MVDFILMGIVGSCLIAVSSLICYESMRLTWAVLPRLHVHPRLRTLLMLIPIFLTHITCIWLYATAIFGITHFTTIGTLSTGTPDFERCLYYSSVVYTTVGFGDLTPLGGLQMLAGAEALNGLVLIGWTVSFTYLTMEKFWDRGRR